MVISILASPDEDLGQLEKMLKDCFLPRGDTIIHRGDLRQPLLGPPDPNIQAVFVMVDSMDALTAARKTVYWNKELPLVMVSESPDYALEGIRLGVRDYLMQPVKPSEIQEAVYRIFSFKREAFA